MAVNVAMEALHSLLAELDPGQKIESCQVSSAHAHGSVRACAVASYHVHVTGVELEGVATPTPWMRALLFKCVASPTERDTDAHRGFRNETLVYTRALPALLKFQASHRVTTPFVGSPSCVAARCNRLLALDDVTARDFRPANASVATPRLLDADQCDTALRELARFHALSLAMRRDRPAAFKEAVLDCVTEVVFLPTQAQSRLSHDCAATEQACAMVDWALPFDDPRRWRYLDHLRQFAGDGSALFGWMVELAAPRGPLSVLCHGACVVDNILFKYDDGGLVKEVCFVEFSRARYSSLALDVATLVCCCASHELRAQRLPRMLADYHGVLVTQLSELLAGTEGAALHGDLEPHALWHSLQAEFHRCCRFGLGVAIDLVKARPSTLTSSLSVATAKSGKLSTFAATDLEGATSRWKPCQENSADCRLLAELVQELTDNGDL